MSGRLAVVAIVADPRHQTRRALDLLRTADVLVTDVHSSASGLPALPGAEAVRVESAEEALATLAEELERGQRVVRAVVPERMAAVLAEEIRPLAEQGWQVELAPFVRAGDAARARLLMPPPSDDEGFLNVPDGHVQALVEALRERSDPATPAALLDRRGAPVYGPVALAAWQYAGEAGQAWSLMLGALRLVGASTGLEARRVLVLRTQVQVEPLRLQLEDAGAVCLEAPILEVAPPDWEPVDALLAGLERYRWAVFTSQNGAAAFFDRLRFLRRDIRTLHARIAAVGSETRRMLQDLGFQVDLVPDPGRSRQQGLLEVFRSLRPVGQSILIATGERRSPALASGLRELGAVVDEAVVYRTRPAALPDWVEPELEAGGIDAVAFTSGSTVRFLMDQLSEDGRARLRECCLVAIGPSTRQEMAEWNLPVGGQAESPGPSGIVAALKRCFSASSAASV
jgi:uroporphyrinogen-III synthase